MGREWLASRQQETLPHPVQPHGSPNALSSFALWAFKDTVMRLLGF